MVHASKQLVPSCVTRQIKQSCCVGNTTTLSPLDSGPVAVYDIFVVHQEGFTCAPPMT